MTTRSCPRCSFNDTTIWRARTTAVGSELCEDTNAETDDQPLVLCAFAQRNWPNLFGVKFTKKTRRRAVGVGEMMAWKCVAHQKGRLWGGVAVAVAVAVRLGFAATLKNSIRYNDQI